jgi:hypothetical protein
MPSTRKSRHCKKRNTHTKKQTQRKRYNKRTQRHTRKRHARRMRGGRTDAPTVDTVEGFPVTEEAVVSIPGRGTYNMKAFKQHEIDMDFQGEEQEQ